MARIDAGDVDVLVQLGQKVAASLKDLLPTICLFVVEVVVASFDVTEPVGYGTSAPT